MFCKSAVVFCEDLLFVFMVMLKGPKVANVKRAFYYYRMNDASVSNTVHKDEHYESLKYVGEEMYKLAPNDCIMVCVRRWMAEYRFLAFKEESVTNEFFRTFFADIKDISTVRCSWLHRFLFNLALCGCLGRTIAMYIMITYRNIKGTRRV